MQSTDETTADRALDLFLAGFDPLLYAADLSLTPEQVFDQIRAALRLYAARIEELEGRLSRRGKGGPKRRPESELSKAAAAVRRSRDKAKGRAAKD